MSEIVEEANAAERRKARIGTVSGLALLTGTTAMAAVGGGHHSFPATALLALLALGMAHSFTVEIQRQAHRRTGRWGRPDTVNTALLSGWAVASLTVAVLPYPPTAMRVMGLLLTTSYVAACAYFVAERHRATAARRSTPPAPHPREDTAIEAAHSLATATLQPGENTAIEAARTLATPTPHPSENTRRETARMSLEAAP
ncbi:hypothetical protein ACWT_0019 [Actinoplanes sp. SE50]|uniref:hypothetical protein n=1 Tax=unclassified Actinoplanes TaxID=2626549 RepID=UPI00023ECDC0|nr:MULTISPECIES: hypothetical protein [unclassified Actinoplanes]AEV81033.1 hypothetical protein ACPL_134 [Actinoplanes sp. SE50/110]ATO79434.1 hypothetical protein ACWT_0019 [Actinoplanes sp. SE50]SLL96834.1 hypothetical protein ACSP50_0021 [Actinoplanes sp. SE50/110]